MSAQPILFGRPLGRPPVTPSTRTRSYAIAPVGSVVEITAEVRFPARPHAPGRPLRYRLVTPNGREVLWHPDELPEALLGLCKGATLTLIGKVLSVAHLAGEEWTEIGEVRSVRGVSLVAEPGLPFAEPKEPADPFDDEETR